MLIEIMNYAVIVALGAFILLSAINYEKVETIETISDSRKDEIQELYGFVYDDNSKLLEGKYRKTAITETYIFVFEIEDKDIEDFLCSSEWTLELENSEKLYFINEEYEVEKNYYLHKYQSEDNKSYTSRLYVRKGKNSQYILVCY